MSTETPQSKAIHATAEHLRAIADQLVAGEVTDLGLVYAARCPRSSECKERHLGMLMHNVNPQDQAGTVWLLGAMDFAAHRLRVSLEHEEAAFQMIQRAMAAHAQQQAAQATKQ